MTCRKLAVYYAWSWPGETSAPLGTIENRFPTLFESRRMLYPQLQDFSDSTRFDQGIGGFISHILKHNFVAFIEQARTETEQPVIEIERIDYTGIKQPIDLALLNNVDTLIILSFDSLRTKQTASAEEIETVRTFLEDPNHLVFVCPHHDIGEEAEETEFFHHGDHTLPPRQGFGGFARSLLAGLGIGVINRYGLHPAAESDGTPKPLEVARSLDRHSILRDVRTFNLHPHLPHFEPTLGNTFDVLAHQLIDTSAPPHPFTANGRYSFDALLQTRATVFAGTVLVGDATLLSSTAGGLLSLQRMWSNLTQRRAMP